jgi:hypothetical protein
MLVLIEPKAMKGEARDLWLQPDESLELRATSPADDDHIHVQDIPEGILVGYFGDLELITAWQGEQELASGYQRPEGWPASLLAEVLRLEEQAYAEGRLYRLNFDVGRSWFTGRLLDGRQVLGLPGEECVFLKWFDAGGNPLGDHELPLPGWRCEFPSWRCEPKSRKLNKEDLDDRLGRAIGFVPGPIDVHQFSFRHKGSHYPFAVEPLPESSSEQLGSWRRHGYGHHWQDSLDHVFEIREWLTEGRYVLHFGNNYWVNRDGEVTDS